MNIKLTIALLLQISVASNVNAANHWVKESSPHFTLYSSHGQSTNESILQSLEDVRRYWAFKVGETRLPSSVVVVAIRSNFEYFPLAGYRNTSGFSTKLPDGSDAMIVTDLRYQKNDLIRYEYAHFVLEHVYDLPWWLEEGMANVCSTLSVNGDQAVLGKYRIDLSILAARPERWDGADVAWLLSNKRPSKARMMTGEDQFGADAGSLVNMLMFSRKYGPRFGNFFALVSSGKSSEAALRDVYDESLKGIQADLARYVWHYYPTKRVALPPSGSAVQFSPASRLSATSVWQIKTAIANGQQALGLISDPRAITEPRWQRILYFHWLYAPLLDPPADAVKNAGAISQAVLATPALSR
jgi:hypothetical protein